MANRSVKFEEWMKAGLDEDKIKLLLELEKSSRLFLHVFDTFGTVDEKLVHRLARSAKKLRGAYEAE